MAEYPKEKVIRGVKSIDNWFSNNKNGTWQELQTENFSVSSDKPTNPLRHDPKFVEICKDIGFAPKYQYQLMQLVVQLKHEVLKGIGMNCVKVLRKLQK